MMSLMPFRMAGRAASNSTSSLLVHSERTEKPPPLDSRHKVSLSHGCKPDTLSKTSRWALVAEMNSSRSLRGRARNGAVLGSINARRIFDTVDLAEPCSLAKASTG
jgi:hypothetical protein